jgi:hypothetical protein
MQEIPRNNRLFEDSRKCQQVRWAAQPLHVGQFNKWRTRLLVSALFWGGTIPRPATCYCPMTDSESPFAKFDLTRAIALRWALRDIRGERLKLTPLADGDLRVLIELGLVEMQDDVPILTKAGRIALE